MKILHQMKGCMGVYFPTPETCEFSTEKCREKCIANLQQLTHTLPQKLKALLRSDIQILINGCPVVGHYPSRKDQLEVWQYFKGQTAEHITLQILEDIQDTDERIIHWFASGDCPSSMVAKVSVIIERLEKYGYVSVGFTRNRALQYAISQNYGPSRFAFTTEKQPPQTKYTGYKEEAYETGLLAVPDYNTGQVKLYYGSQENGGCGGGVYTREDIRHEGGCSDCFINQCGCFFKLRLNEKYHKILWAWRLSKTGKKD